ncbi:MAG: M48 family metalloprotease, partial [Phycisphaerales bacterium JB039]
ALILVPLTALLIWHDTIVWTEMQAGGWLVDRLGLRGAGVALTGAEIAGAAALFLLLPALMRRVWETVPLGPGKLRDDLLDMCARNRVRIREILVWRTDGMMANAAVMGLARPLRYILITDGLLERLPREQVDAVMAHEIAHIRRCHLPWLAVAVIGALLAIALALRPLDPALARLGGAGEAIEGALLLLGAGLVFGLVSRRFEWQADAFAAADRSIAETAPDGPATVTPAAVHAMSGALLAVAVLNHVAPARFSFRHGSIRSRRRRLGRLVGRRVDRLGIDRQVRIIKMLSMLGLAIAVAGWILVS